MSMNFKCMSMSLSSPWQHTVLIIKIINTALLTLLARKGAAGVVE